MKKINPSCIAHSVNNSTKMNTDKNAIDNECKVAMNLMNKHELHEIHTDFCQTYLHSVLHIADVPQRLGKMFSAIPSNYA